MKNLRCLCFIGFLLINACSHPSRLEQALRLAGDNRMELEKVLAHYSQHPGDSLKLRAAEFLIANMPGHYAFDSELLQHFRNELMPVMLEHDIIEDDAMKILEEKYGKFQYGKPDVVYDIHIITAAYLIDNIEQSFNIWEHTGWKHQMTFEDFCEEILPYRVSTEPVEDWKEAYYNVFQPVLDSLLVNKRDPVEACQILYDYIIQERWQLYQKSPLPSMSPLTMLSNKIGTCKDRADFMGYVMKSVGIPGGCDFLLQNPENNTPSHYWSMVKDTLGNTVEYTIYDLRPLDTDPYATRKGRIYRNCFGRQAISLPNFLKEKDIPASLNNAFMKDVTTEYLSGYDMTLYLEKPDNTGKQSYVYLSLFNNTGWVPVTWAAVEGDKAAFTHVAPDIVYFPVYYSNGKFYHASMPVLMQNDGSFIYLDVEEGKKQDISMTRKYPKPRSVWYRERSIGGKFQGANDPDFKHPVTFFTIAEDQVDMDWHHVEMETSEQFRYVRYLSAPEAHSNIAEIEFISSAGEVLNGEIIGTDGIFRNHAGREKETVFDKDPLTFYDAKEASGDWVGLALTDPASIKEIRYIFRNDDNGIAPGNEYELFYWDNHRWNSLGKKIAQGYVLTYEDCPVGPLYILRNLTRGKEERIFIYENGKQVWH